MYASMPFLSYYLPFLVLVSSPYVSKRIAKRVNACYALSIGSIILSYGVACLYFIASIILYEVIYTLFPN